MRETPNQQQENAAQERGPKRREVTIELLPEEKGELRKDQIEYLVEEVEGLMPHQICATLFNMTVYGRPDKLDKYEQETLISLFDMFNFIGGNQGDDGLIEVINEAMRKTA